MRRQKEAQPVVTFKVWESTKELLPYASWLPTVVGTYRELIHIGSIPVPTPMAVELQSMMLDKPESVDTSLRFRDADITKYRKILSLFRRRNSTSRRIEQA